MSEPEPVEESDDGALGEAIAADVHAPGIVNERLGAVLWRVVVGTANDEARAFFGSLPPAEVARWFGDAEAQLLLEQDGLMAAAVAAVRSHDEQTRAANVESGLRALKFALRTHAARRRVAVHAPDSNGWR